MKSVGIIGYGFVGLACETGFQDIADVRVYDKYKNTESLEAVVRKSKILFLCLPTPMSQDGSCDTSIIRDTVARINDLAISTKLIVLKSTVPPGTTQSLADEFQNHQFVFNPEFLREKTFVQDFLNQNRIILGTTKGFDLGMLSHIYSLYDKFVKRQKADGAFPAEMIITNSTIAEMVKYTTNAYLATKLSFFNEIHQICESIDVDYGAVRDFVLKDPRIEKSHTSVPGHDGDYGWGGKCLVKDVNALIAFCWDRDIDETMLTAAWFKNLMVRKDHDWEAIPGATHLTGFEKE